MYVAALILGNAELPHRAATRSFSEGVAWLAQIGLFVMLGLLLTPEPDRPGEIVGLAVVAGPGPDVRGAADLGRWSARSSSRCPGASWPSCPGPACAARCRSCSATIPLAEGVDGAEQLFDIVFVMVVIYTLLTGPTLPLVGPGAQGGAAQRAA